MSWFSKLFGGGDAGGSGSSGFDAVEYNGFTITPNPMKAGSEWRVAATVEKDGRTHQLIRADTLGSADAAAEAAIGKAKQMIDQQGDAIF